jgi:hypothetical protein
MKLYKYVTPERIDILKHARIGFSHASVFNDPFEMRPFFEYLEKEARLRQGLNGQFTGRRGKIILECVFKLQYFDLPAEVKTATTYKEFRETRRKEAKDQQVVEKLIDHATDLMSDKHSMTANIRDGLLHGITGLHCVLSLTRKRDDLLMWAHYANNHQGFVLEFDGDHNYFNRNINRAEQDGYLRPVRYLKNRPQREAFKDITATDLLLVKSEEWKYEKEYRMLRNIFGSVEVLKGKLGSTYLFPIPTECITGVVLGNLMSKTNMEDILSILTNDRRYNHVKKYRVELHERKFKLNITSIEV